MMTTPELTDKCWQFIEKHLQSVNGNESFTVHKFFDGYELYCEVKISGYDEWNEKVDLEGEPYKSSRYDAEIELFGLNLVYQEDDIDGVEQIRKELQERMNRD
jgi:hypothetical protein